MATTRQYRVRANRDEDGYTVSYGKASKKLQLRLAKRSATRWSFIEAPADLQGVYPSFSDAKTAFEAWAVQVYGTDSAPTLVEENPLVVNQETGHGQSRIPGPPSLSAAKRAALRLGLAVREGPPTYKKPRSDVDEDNRFIADFLNPAFYTAEEGTRRLTPLGALEEVYKWMLENVDMRKDGKYPWESVRKVLQRALPDVPKYKMPLIRP